MLLFLSRGYFLSKNCLREMRAAINLGKPILLVHECSVKHGGAELRDFYDECPQSLRKAVFGVDAFADIDLERLDQIVAWHRVTDYQRLSLLRIARNVLLANPPSPRDWKLVDRTCESFEALVAKLYDPRSTVERDVAITGETIMLMVSPCNPGAAEVAAELRQYFIRRAEASVRQNTRQSRRTRYRCRFLSRDRNSTSGGRSSSSDQSTTGSSDTRSTSLQRCTGSRQTTASVRGSQSLNSTISKVTSLSRANTASKACAAASANFETVSIKFTARPERSWRSATALDVEQGQADGEASPASPSWIQSDSSILARSKAAREAAHAIMATDPLQVRDICLSGWGSNSCMLLLLNMATWSTDFSEASSSSRGVDADERREELAEHLRAARRAGMPILLFHQLFEDDGPAATFERFMCATPDDLVEGGLYQQLATPLTRQKEERELSFARALNQIEQFDGTMANKGLAMFKWNMDTVIRRRSSGHDHEAAPNHHGRRGSSDAPSYRATDHRRTPMPPVSSIDRRTSATRRSSAEEGTQYGRTESAAMVTARAHAIRWLNQALGEATSAPRTFCRGMSGLSSGNSSTSSRSSPRAGMGLSGMLAKRRARARSSANVDSSRSVSAEGSAASASRSL